MKPSQPATLGDVLYAKDQPKALVAETMWLGLVESIAERDLLALRVLYTRTYGVVFTWIVRLVGDWDTSEELTLDVFHDVWSGAPTYDAAGNSVVGWIMDQARSRVIAQQPFEQRTPWPPALEVVSSPADVLSPSPSLWERLARRIAVKPMKMPSLLAHAAGVDPEWNEVAPGICCQLLATDREQHRVSMLVWLAPGFAYPPHTHAGIEELYLLHGELMIEGRKLYPGDYNRAEPASRDQSVWTETGCICVLLTSTRDVLR